MQLVGAIPYTIYGITEDAENQLNSQVGGR